MKFDRNTGIKYEIYHAGEKAEVYGATIAQAAEAFSKFNGDNDAKLVVTSDTQGGIRSATLLSVDENGAEEIIERIIDRLDDASS